MTKLLVLLALLTTTAATADLRNPPSSTERQFFYHKNNLSNGGFEGGKTGWSSAITLTTTSGQVFEGTQAGAWDPSGASTVQSPTWTTKAATVVNAVGSCKILTADADYDLQVYDGSTVVAEVNVPAGTFAQDVGVQFVAAASTTYRIRLEAQGDESVAYIDDCYLGESKNTGTDFVQNQFVGSAYIAGTASCSFNRTNTAFGAFSTTAACPGPTVEVNAGPGVIQTTDTDLPRFTVNDLPSGTYEVGIYATFRSDTNSARADLTISDGTSLSGRAQGSAATGGNDLSPGTVIGVFTYTSTGNRTFELQGLSTSGTITVFNDPAYQTRFWIKRFPLTSQTLLNADNTNYGWTAYTPTFTGFGTVSGVSCYHKRNGEQLQVRCTFTPGTTTATEARVSFPGSLVAASTIPTLEYAGAAVIRVTTNGFSSVLREPSVSYFTFGRDDGSSNAFAKFNGSTWVVSGNAVSFLAEVPINGWSENQNAPQFIGSVISNSLGVERLERAHITNGGSCAIASQSGSWIASVAHPATGRCTLTLTSGMFSSGPTCTMVPITTSGVSHRIRAANTTSTIEANTTDIAGAGLDVDFYIMCIGPK